MSHSFNHEHLKHWSHPTSFVRGEKYYQQGRVLDYIREGTVSKANIVGTALYPVAIDWLNTTAFCSCPAFEKYWCKHLVALALTELDGVVVAKKPPKIKQTANAEPLKPLDQGEVEKTFERPELPEAIQKYLQQMSDTERHQMLEMILAQSIDAQKILTRQLSQTYSSVEVIKSIKKFISAMKRSVYGEAYFRNKKAIEALLLDEVATWKSGRSAAMAQLEIVEFVYQQLRSIHDVSESLHRACRAVIHQAITYVNTVGLQGLDTLALFLQHSDEELVYLMLEILIHDMTHSDIQRWWQTELEKSNVQVLKSIALPRDKLHCFIADTLSSAGHSDFLSIIKHCEKAQPLFDSFYAEYYFQIQDWAKYLSYQSKAESKRYTEERLLQAYSALQDWKKVEETTISLMKKNQIVSLIRRYMPTLIYALNQQYDTTQKQKHLDRYANQFIKMMDDDLVAAELALMFYQPELAIQYLLNCLRARYESGYTYNFVSSDQMPQIKILIERISLYSDDMCIQLNLGILREELIKLTTTKSNHYDMLYAAISQLMMMGQVDEVMAFYETLRLKMPNRKTVISWIEQCLKNV